MSGGAGILSEDLETEMMHVTSGPGWKSARCGSRGSFVVAGPIDIADRPASFATLVSFMVSPDRLCRKCFDSVFRVAFAGYVKR